MGEPRKYSSKKLAVTKIKHYLYFRLMFSLSRQPTVSTTTSVMKNTIPSSELADAIM